VNAAVAKARLDLNAALAKASLHRRLPAPAVRRALRDNAGLTQQDVADVCGVSRVSIARYEAGTRDPRGAVQARYVELLMKLVAEAKTA
jgi:predicted transcriptional regulator